MRERAAAHEGQRRDLDLARSDPAGHLFGRQHVVQRVIERAEIGVHLLLQVAGQEAQALPGLDRRARQHDAVDPPGLQQGDALRHRQVGLAGAGGADAEDHLVPRQQVDVGGLGRAAGGDRAPCGCGSPAGPATAGAGRSRCRLRPCAALPPHPRCQRVGPFPAAATGRAAPTSATSVRSGVPPMVSRLPARAEPYPQTLLDARQVAVVFPVQQGEQGVVVELQRDGALVRRGWGRGGRPRGGAGIPGAEDDGGVVQAGAGSSARRLALGGPGWSSSPAASVPERELACAASTRAGATRPISDRSPSRCTGCSQGERPMIWPGCRPGPVKSTGKVSPTRDAVEGVLLVAQQGLQRLQPGVLHRLRHLARRAGGRRAGAGGVLEAVGHGEADLVDQRHGGGEIGLGLAGMADDEVGGQGESGPRLPQPVHHAAEVVRGMAAVHRRQHAVRARLHRQVQVGHQRLAGRDGRRSGRRPCRAGGWWCSAAAAGRGSRPARAAAGRGPSCRRPGAAPCQAFTFCPSSVDLPRPGGDQAPRLGQHRGGGAGVFGAAGIGHHAEGAELVAALLHREEGGHALGCRLPPAGGRTCLSAGKSVSITAPAARLARATISGRRW